MSEAQLDTGDTGSSAENSMNDMLGNPENDDAVLLYGVISLSSALITIFFYVWFNAGYYITASHDYFLSHVAAYLPVGMGWLMVSLFDGAFMRDIFTDLIWLSIMGPFFFHWYATVSFIINGDNGGSSWSGTGSVTAYDEFLFWLTWILQACLTIFEMIMQVVILPKVLDWVETAEILDNGAEQQENLFVI